MNQRFKSNEVEEFAFDHLSSIEIGGLLSRRELMRRATLFGAASTLGTFTVGLVDVWQWTPFVMVILLAAA